MTLRSTHKVLLETRLQWTTLKPYLPGLADPWIVDAGVASGAQLNSPIRGVESNTRAFRLEFEWHMNKWMQIANKFFF